MLDWDYLNPRFMNIDLEEFKPERVEETVRKIGKHLGFSFDWQQSLLTSFKRVNANEKLKASHGTAHQGDVELSNEVLEYVYDCYPLANGFMERVNANS